MICVPEETFSRLVAQAYADGYAVHGEIDLEMEVFANRLRQAVEKHLQTSFSDANLSEFFRSLHTTDLYLASGCSQPSDAAWRRFEAAYRKFINDVARFVVTSADEAHELAADVEAHLYMPGRSGQSRMASFDGQQSLPTWLRFVITRRASYRKALRWNRVEPLDQAENIADDSSIARIEASLRRRHYEPMVEDCFREACNNLSDRERLIILLRYGQGLRMTEIANSLGVHPSGITRGLHRAEAKLHKTTKSLLTLRYQLSSASIQEALADLLENAAHSPLTVLRESATESQRRAQPFQQNIRD
jgi:RNA polymerase sigma-70 factor